jgi:AraC-like DNA-binding protein
LLQSIKPTCVEELSQVVQPWQLALRQLSKGALQPSIAFTAIDDILVTNDRWRGRIHGYGGTAAGYFTLVGSFTSCHIPWKGQALEENTIIFAAGNTEWEFHTPDGTNHWVMFIPEHTLAGYMGLQPQEILGTDSRRLLLDPQQFRRMGALAKQILAPSPHPARALAAEQRLKGRILAETADALSGLAVDRDAATCRTRYAAYRKAIRYVNASGPPATMQELAAAAGVSVRILQLAFRENLGHSPHHYLRLNRLHQLHSRLRMALPGETTVTALMSQCGFMQYGRVAGDYKELFGESPSATLAHQPGPAPGSSADALAC